MFNMNKRNLLIQAWKGLKIHICILCLVLILDRNSEHVAHGWRKIWRSFFEINFKFSTALDQNKSPKQIKLPFSLFTCSPISEVPSDINTMTLCIIPGETFCQLFLFIFDETGPVPPRQLSWIILSKSGLRIRIRVFKQHGYGTDFLKGGSGFGLNIRVRFPLKYIYQTVKISDGRSYNEIRISILCMFNQVGTGSTFPLDSVPVFFQTIIGVFKGRTWMRFFLGDGSGSATLGLI